MKNITNEIRKNIIKMVTKSYSSHVGSCLSIVDILYVLYFKVLNVDTSDPKKTSRDKFILSKAHGSAALYATLAEKGFFPKSYLEQFYVDDGKLPGHLDKEIVPGVETSGGSLGHGLSIGVGMAIANIHDENPGKVFVLIGDGESNEGAVWEAVMLASTLKLSNLTVVVDYNKLQSFGRTNEVINQENMPERWRAFGWEVHEADGHNVDELEEKLQYDHDLPKVIIAHTVKGKGISYMENKLEWHYKSPNEEEYKTAMKELET